MKNKQKIIRFYLFFALVGIFLLGNFEKAQAINQCESSGGTCEIDPGDPSGQNPNRCPYGKETSSESCDKNNYICCKTSKTPDDCCEKLCKPPEGGKCMDGTVPVGKACSEIESCKSTPPGGTTSDVTGGYAPMEEIPGFGRPGSWPSYILAVYQFGIWTIGISAMLMIMIGGYMYIMSAGNAASAGKAKDMITDAIAGLVLALSIWIILHTINPNLVNLPETLPFSLSLGTGSGSIVSNVSNPSSGQASDSKCSPMTTGSCSVENLRKYFGANAEKASGICHAESNGSETIPSGVDRCLPGKQSVSFGLFQINISANNVADVPCVDRAVSPVYTSKNHNCTPQSDYEKCKKAAQTAEKNILQAVKMSKNGTHWGQWGANSAHCHFDK